VQQAAPELAEIPGDLLQRHRLPVSGGWRMRSRLAWRTRMQGGCAETGRTATLVVAIWSGVPVFTMHTITGAIIGAGAARGPSAMRWNATNGIVFARVGTIPVATTPAAGTVAVLFCEVARLLS
jgi:hypothetical protein